MILSVDRQTVPDFTHRFQREPFLDWLPCWDVRTHKHNLILFPAGLSIDGLYRVSGNLAVIQKLRFAVNHGKANHHFL